jgi:hypothetical protein
MYWFYVDGKKTSVHTWISHGERKYEKQLLAKVRSQIRLQDWDEFRRFVECPMQYGAYLNLMVARGHVKLPAASKKPKK